MAEDSFLSGEGKMLVCEDPLSTEPLKIEEIFPRSEENSCQSESVIDVEGIDELIDFRLLEHCSRTLGWTRERKKPVAERSSRVQDESSNPAGTDDSSRKLTPADVDQNENSASKNSRGKSKRCLQCSVKFKNVSELKEHEEKKECLVIGCSFCNTLLLRSQLQDHLKSCLEKPLPYSCLICKKSFSLLNALTGHQASHVEDKLARCYACGQEYSDWKKVRDHRKTCGMGRTIRPEPKFPIFRCGECSSAYSKVSSLAWHLRSKKHVLCMCGDCGVTCSRFSALCSHIESKHQNYCHGCSKCSKKFIDVLKWKSHTSVCSGKSRSSKRSKR